MKRSLFFLPLLFIFFSFSVLAEDLKEKISIPVGNIIVQSFLDNSGYMEKDLFPTLPDYPDLEKFFANGPLLAVNRCYVVEDNGHNVLIDTGWGEDLVVKGKLFENLYKNGINPNEITDILLTHMDFDHIGGLIAHGKATFPNVKVWISRPEYEGCLKDKVSKREPWAYDLAKQMAALYKDNIVLFDPGEKIFPKISTLDISGHTPGHTAYIIEDNGEKLLIAGDFVHASPIQIIEPRLSDVYDMDFDKAAQARQKILKKVAEDKCILGAMHMPQIGFVEEPRVGSYIIKAIPDSK